MAITFEDGRAPVCTDVSMRMGALGERGALLRQDASGGMDLALKANVPHVRTAWDPYRARPRRLRTRTG